MSAAGEYLRRYKLRMKDAGFKRLQLWVHPDLLDQIRRQTRPSECGGRCLERLILGEARKRPRYEKPSRR